MRSFFFSSCKSSALFACLVTVTTPLIARAWLQRTAHKLPEVATGPRIYRPNTLFLSQHEDLSHHGKGGESLDLLSLAEEDRLFEIARRLKLEVLDVEDGHYGYESQDYRFGLEVLHSKIPIIAGRKIGGDVDESELGVELTEMAGAPDGRGLVLISGVSGAAAATSPTLRVGDVLTGVSVEGTSFRERLTGLNYELTVEAIARAKEAAAELASRTDAPDSAGHAAVSFEADRLVKRAPVKVEVVESGSSSVLSIDSLAGENLRQVLQRKQVKIYNPNTKRFDMPFSTGDCAGEGLCGTCLVKVEEGMDLMSPRDSLEELITKGRPSSWRASCRAVIGHENRPGTIRVHTQPQTGHQEEIDRGVQPI